MSSQPSDPREPEPPTPTSAYTAGTLAFLGALLFITQTDRLDSMEKAGCFIGAGLCVGRLCGAGPGGGLGCALSTGDREVEAWSRCRHVRWTANGAREAVLGAGFASGLAALWKRDAGRRFGKQQMALSQSYRVRRSRGRFSGAWGASRRDMGRGAGGPIGDSKSQACLHSARHPTYSPSGDTSATTPCSPSTNRP